MLVTLADLYNKLPKGMSGGKILPALKVLEKEFDVKLHINVKGVDYFIANPKNIKP